MSSKSVLIVFLVLVSIIAYAFYSAVDVFAMSESGGGSYTVYARPGGDCLANHYSGDIWTVGNEWYCGVVPSESAKNSRKEDTKVNAELPVADTQEVVNEPVVTPEPVVTENPVTPEPVETPTVHEDKPKCNNGEGNGAEGCSPAKSVHANNDENDTTPKEDKANK